MVVLGHQPNLLRSTLVLRSSVALMVSGTVRDYQATVTHVDLGVNLLEIRHGKEGVEGDSLPQHRQEKAERFAPQF